MGQKQLKTGCNQNYNPLLFGVLQGRGDRFPDILHQLKSPIM
jgi:hypothetical protein